jgi:LmbE family N-acetylglucosaminyl deacetylase
MKALAVVAHPDDETIFFGGYLLKHPHYEWTIVSVTYTADSARGTEFLEACSRYRAKGILLGHKDGLNHEIEGLEADLENLKVQNFDLIFSHNEQGEYGHFQHQLVHRAVKSVFPFAYAFGYNSQADLQIQLNTFELGKKRKILKECYPSQSQKWALQLFDLSQEKLITPNFQSSAVEEAFLGKNDFWDYGSSAYEIARHAQIVQATQETGAKTILEIGCHEGILTKALSAVLGVTALERSEVATARAKAAAPLAEIVSCDLAKIPVNHSIYRRLEEKEFDAVLCAEVLYYLPNFEVQLERLIRGPQWFICQHSSKFHSRVEAFFLKQGAKIVKSARASSLGLGVYRLR